MKRRLPTLLAAGAIALLAATSAPAHHSMTGYDREHQTKLQGTVTQFSWSNPHAQLFFEAQENGTTEKWMAEMPSPNRLDSSGWSKEIVKPGDQITVVGNRAKDGGTSMRLMKIILANGKELDAYTF